MNECDLQLIYNLFFFIGSAGYKPLPDVDRYLVPAAVQLPLDKTMFSCLLEAAKACMTNNFFSCFATIAGNLLLFYYEYIKEQQSSCPLILCYSASCGTGMYAKHKNNCDFSSILAGKTTAMKIALSLFGALEENGNSPKTSASSLLMQTALGTLPIGKHTIVSELCVCLS